jgi:hypothetical protein
MMCHQPLEFADDLETHGQVLVPDDQVVLWLAMDRPIPVAEARGLLGEGAPVGAQGQDQAQGEDGDHCMRLLRHDVPLACLK